ncbi:MAG: Ig-like domain-containing protein [Lachnospiraceae bacterium]|nr:Ig-like domain-containing protein [Lachnospiraceae bacterium]
MKRILSMMFATLLLFFMVPQTVQAAETVTLTVKADKSVANPGDTVNFSVSIGAVQNLGGLEFQVDAQDGITISEESVVIPEGVAVTLDSDGDIVKPTKVNGFKWSYSAQSTGYTGSGELVILTFSASVDESASFEEKSVTLIVDTCFDNSTDLNDFSTNVNEAKVTVEKAKVSVTGVTLDNSTLSLKTGETATLTATVMPNDADNKSLTWSSNNGAVASVTNGIVTAVSPGTAKIMVTTVDGNKTAECMVTVTCAHSMTKTEAVAPTCTKDGNIAYYTCGKCSTKFADEAGTTKVTDTVVKANGHKPVNNWEKDANEHWKECENCDTKLEKANHSFSWVVDKAATEDATGLKHEECACGIKQSEGTEIPKLDHVHTGIQYVAAVKATCVKTGTKEYWTCSSAKCAGKYYGDKACQTELANIIVPVDANNHEPVDKWNYDKDNHWKVCEDCKSKFSTEKHTFNWVVDKKATEDATGLKHEECACGWKQSEGTEIPKLDHVHIGIQHVDAIPATCMKEGTKEYWTCSSAKCSGKYYSDVDCQIELTDITVPKNAENHVTEGTWNADVQKHVRICACGVKVSEGIHEYDDSNDAFCNICNYKRYYMVTDGNAEIYTRNESDALIFEIEGELALFQVLKIDGAVLEATNYTLAEGSTIITLLPTYLDTLEEGTHKLEALYSDGKIAMAEFKIEKEDSEEDAEDEVEKSEKKDAEKNATAEATPLKDNVPKTGESFPVLLVIAMCVCVAGTAYTFKRKKN